MEEPPPQHSLTEESPMDEPPRSPTGLERSPTGLEHSEYVVAWPGSEQALNDEEGFEVLTPSSSLTSSQLAAGIASVEEQQDSLLDALARRDTLLLEERRANEELVGRLQNQAAVARALAGLDADERVLRAATALAASWRGHATRREQRRERLAKFAAAATFLQSLARRLADRRAAEAAEANRASGRIRSALAAYRATLDQTSKTALKRDTLRERDQAAATLKTLRDEACAAVARAAAAAAPAALVRVAAREAEWEAEIARKDEQLETQIDRLVESHKAIKAEAQRREAGLGAEKAALQAELAEARSAQEAAREAARAADAHAQAVQASLEAERAAETEAARAEAARELEEALARARESSLARERTAAGLSAGLGAELEATRARLRESDEARARAEEALARAKQKAKARAKARAAEGSSAAPLGQSELVASTPRASAAAAAAASSSLLALAPVMMQTSGGGASRPAGLHGTGGLGMSTLSSCVARESSSPSAQFAAAAAAAAPAADLAADSALCARAVELAARVAELEAARLELTLDKAALVADLDEQSKAFRALEEKMTSLALDKEQAEDLASRMLAEKLHEDMHPSRRGAGARPVGCWGGAEPPAAAAAAASSADHRALPADPRTEAPARREEQASPPGAGVPMGKPVAPRAMRRGP